MVVVQGLDVAHPSYIHTSVVTDIIQKIDESIHADRRLTIDELHQQCPGVSRTVLHDIVTKILGYQKLGTCWVPKMLTDNHKKNQVDVA
jgi:hypothetical protein